MARKHKAKDRRRSSAGRELAQDAVEEVADTAIDALSSPAKKTPVHIEPEATEGMLDTVGEALGDAAEVAGNAAEAIGEAAGAIIEGIGDAL
ncbi:MAG: hypothetical protein A3C93_02165 [Candidatus Lloydbacteria bacterium RIFCSPHIGHO2_02_FULL_54_17]|uniref:Uncharacterized protein n=1 Tax=Candidatus Lloydbacteria bacterium RIFCSPHIGHO2_02_FULL_54_17 TaxID=1798664 RepID=A0A1G2DDK8_9BACT|nr:MAG: hypothetical protein A2762_02245 [Candidatus Lloydbacteria bacterium RIFCSPHIGHO2_01_FULL_54_11]OGZ11719.1 MAG: hypothetical protein A3C93_02165 [Candidatus Lloydbacteria bacterium RIFCSPHIGHO2_02_FULL_54_17]OGZ14248.1 MAG: hypothetical protein A2948_01500 [Candidatus Lloydbacteria bacterium RIFCSPLOWO2_01_FULL_54_18]OGZ16593.1 MAG: hypothetical protein A3H76_04140 [Candidatus Lloydbacteria bacterium RIFCSPLOWO2_02_FULL_54_12]